MLSHRNIMANDVILNCIESGCAVEPYFPGFYHLNLYLVNN